VILIKDYLYDNQLTLFGERTVIGFGDNDFRVMEIDRNLANKTIIKSHYSHKIYNATYIHLGVFAGNEMLGVLQYGYAMNPASQASVVADTEMDEYLELNRMWLDDKMPRNSESQAISCSIKYIKRKFKGKIKWIQSFADERCGRFGVVYHNIQMTVSEGTKRYTPEVEKLQKNKDRAKRMTLRQFRYIYFIDGRYKQKCLLKEEPYPKHGGRENNESKRNI